MSGLFSIPLNGLTEGHHTFDFEINKEFFDLFEESEVKEGALVAITEVEKRSSHIDLLIKITGKVRISCDRCLDMFEHPVDCENRLIAKFGKLRDDSDSDIIMVPSDEPELDMKQYLYEFIHLALPIQRVHPEDKAGKSTCNPVMLEKLGEHKIEEEKKNDPRWDDLKKFINNN
jgi:uncharacterized metal-binding protein YceD (DUF177 family)